MQLNAEDGGNRKFIMVQLPELCDEKSEAYKAGYKNICEIGKERIRRAGAKMSETKSQLELDLDKNSIDIGFRVFKLDTSNFIKWDSSSIPDDDVTTLINRLNNMIERLKSDRTVLDVVFEIILKIGIELTEVVEKVDFNGITAYSVREDCLLLICLEENLTTELVIEMAECFAPGRMVFGQKSFPDLTSMSNAKLHLRARKIEIKFV